MGGSNPNSDFDFFLEIACFSCFCFNVSKCLKKNKKLDNGVGKWGLTNPCFSRISGFFST